MRHRKMRAIRFLVVGALNTIVGYAIYAGCLWFGVYYGAAIAVSTILGALFNFKSTSALVFHSTDNRRFGRFILIYGLLYALNVTGVAFLLRLGFDAYEAGLVLIFPLAMASYLLQSRLVFTSNVRD